METIAAFVWSLDDPIFQVGKSLFQLKGAPNSQCQNVFLLLTDCY